MDISLQTVNSFYEHVPVGFFRCFQNGVERKFQLVTPYVQVLLGLTHKDLLVDARTFFCQIHPEDRNKFLRACSLTSGSPAVISLEYRIIRDNNHVIWVQEHSVMLRDDQGQGNMCEGVLMEIPNYQGVQDELRRWDQELQSLTNNFPDIVGRMDRKRRILYLNKWWENFTQIPPEQYLGKRLSELGLSWTVSELFEENIQRVFESGHQELLEISLPTSHGIKIFEVRFIPEADAQKDVATVLLIWRDVTDVRTAERAYKESDEKFLQLAETIDSVFWIWDTKLQRMVYVSPAYERLWGADAAKLLANPLEWLTVVYQDDRARVENIFLKRIGQKSCDIEYRIITNNKEIRWIHNRTFPLKEPVEEATRVMGLAQDVTERKKLEEDHIRSAKLESLGLLAGGLAHDFNNLLTAIIGQLSLAKYGLKPNHSLFPKIDEAEKASLRAQDIARQLLTFSKGGVPVKKPVALKRMLEENVRLVLAGSKVKSVFQISPDLWDVDIDVGQISQVIHNLVINARQAMEQGGECIIQAHNIGQEDVAFLPFKPILESVSTRWVRVGILDQGVGIPKENLSKIFDPYFTTKSTGSGLGLATSYSIIKSHGGMLAAESQVGKGSTFSFLLPAMPSKNALDPSFDSDVKFGQGKILIMDDESQIRRVLGEMVEMCGYQFQAAHNGEEALQLFRQAQQTEEPFSGVILDLTIPGGLGGKDVISQLLLLDPQVRAIVVSGYSNDPVLANYEAYGFRGRVAKPFNLVDLSGVLKSVLQEPVS